ELLRAHRALGVVGEAPRRAPPPRRWAPGALLEREEQTEHQRVPARALERRQAVVEGEIGRRADPDHRDAGASVETGPGSAAPVVDGELDEVVVGIAKIHAGGRPPRA